MAIVSDIEIRLAADIAHLRQNMNEARSTVDRAMGGITNAAKLAGGALAGLAAGMSVAAFAGWIKGAIDATDVVSDLSQKTGVAIEQIAGLQLWFQKGGMEAGSFESSMVKLSKNIAEGGEAFDRLGIKTKDSNGQLRSNVEVLIEAADKFAGLEDGTQKTALALEIFGKSGAELLPMLNEGSDGLRAMNEMAEKLGITFDQKTVNAAGDFNDTLDFLGLATQGVARQVAAQLLPTLNSLAGSFLETVTKGDMVRRTADAIGFALKALYSVGVGIVQVFTTVGDTLGASAAVIMSVLKGDFATARQIALQFQTDVSSGWSQAAKTISDVWTGAGGETVAALAGMAKQSTVVADKVDKDAKKQADAHKELIASIREKIRETDREAMGLSPLNDAQKMAIKLDEEMTAGKVKLTAAQKAQVSAQIALYEANLLAIDSQKARKKMEDDLQKLADQRAADAQQEIDDARKEAEAQETLAKNFGLTAAQVAALEVARLREQLANKASLGLTLEEIERLEKLIPLRERAASAMADAEGMRENQKMWESIEKTAHDTFISIIDGGKGAAQRLKDTFKNTFFDWLYQQTIKKWVFNVQANTSGIGSAAGGAGDLLSNLSNLMGNGTGSLASILTNGIQGVIDKLGFSMGSGAPGSLASTLGQAGSMYAGYQMGNGINSMISGKYSVGGGGVQKAATAIASYFGPLASSVTGAVLGLVNRAFGRGPKEIQSQGLQGTFGTDSFAGNNFAEWVKKGGWFRSDKRGTDTTALGADQAAALNTAYKAIKDSTSAFATALGQPTDTIDSYTKTIKLVSTGDAAKDQAALAQLFADMGDELAGRVLPNIADFVKQGETAAATLGRLATEFQTVDAVLTALNLTSKQAFGAVGVASLAARDRLVQLSGGLEAFTAQADYFAQNFMTEAERLAPTQKVVTEQLAALGYSGLQTTEQFKNAVMALARSGALATEAGAETYARLLELAPAFKAVADAAAQAAEAAKEAAAAQVEALRANAADMFAALQRAVDADKKNLTNGLKDVLAGFDAAIAATSAKVSNLNALASALSSASGAVLGDSQAGAARMQAQAELAAAAAIARASGVLPSADKLAGALAAVSRPSDEAFASLIDEQRSTLLTANSIEELSGLTSGQLAAAETSLKVLQDQRALAQKQYDDEMARLDRMLEVAQSQLDAVNGARTDVASVAAAFASFAASISAALGNRTIASQPSVTGATMIESLYNSVLGRASDSGGMQFYLDQLAAGASLDAIRNEFLNSPEYLSRGPSYSAQQSGTMGGNEIAAGLQNMNAKLDAIATSTGQFAQQFSQVSNGGNSLLTEPA